MVSVIRRNNWLWYHHGSITHYAPDHLIMHGPTLNLLIYNCEKKVKKNEKKVKKKVYFCKFEKSKPWIKFLHGLNFLHSQERLNV